MVRARYAGIMSVGELVKSYQEGTLKEPSAVRDLLILLDLLAEDDPISMAEPPPVRNARLLAEETIRGGDKSPAAFADLIGLLLRFTVVKNPQGGRIIWQPRRSGSRKVTTVVISGWNKTNALIPLNNGGFLD